MNLYEPPRVRVADSTAPKPGGAVLIGALGIPWVICLGTLYFVTPAIAEGIGLGAAVDFLQEVGMEWIWQHEHALTSYAYARLAQVEGLRILGPGPEQRGGLVAFTLGEVHPHDLSAVLDNDGIAIRAGHHCAQPIHDRLGIVASARASFYLYNTFEEVDKLVVGLEKAGQIFAF